MTLNLYKCSWGISINNAMKKKQAKEQVQHRQRIRIVPFIVILVFLILGIVGVGMGEPSRILKLATQICLSCMGIG